MEINVKVRADRDEIERVFEYDDVINIRYYELVGNGVYNAIIRIPECNISERGIKTLESIKNEVVLKCPEEFKICSKVVFKNGDSKTIYASTDYWKNFNANEIARLNNTEVEKIEVISNTTQKSKENLNKMSV